jgi:prevent-host-death family protein
MARINTGALISISEADRMGVSSLIQRAEADGEQILTRHGKPVGAVVSIERLTELQDLEAEIDEAWDLSLAAARLLTTSEQRHSLDEVLAYFGYSREQLGEYVK